MDEVVDPKADTKQGDYEFIERAGGDEELQLRQVALHEEVEDTHSGVGACSGSQGSAEWQGGVWPMSRSRRSSHTEEAETQARLDRTQK